MFHLDHLPGALPNEKSVAVMRRHWTALVPLALAAIVILCLPAVSYAFVKYIRPEFFSDPVSATLFVLGISLFFLYAWLFIFQQYLDYYLDTWIVTTERIINIEQHGLFARTISELRLFRVQDVTSEVHGVLQTMLDFGDLLIQTAGEQERFHFEDIPHPSNMAQIILDLSEKCRKKQLDVAVEEFGVSSSKS